ncbi:hypothetical protein [Ectobacillus polymachus]|uniref:hypothetical protein n=1 Tax=Ectobacillus polymachus TaxID=1508806 RepID=UPI003A8809E3
MTKLNPFIIATMFINTCTMGMYAYRNFSAFNIEVAITFTILSIMFFCFGVYGVIRNCQSKTE